MSREISFRIKSDGIWIYYYSIFSLDELKTDNKTFGQYIGINDKNGNEICEGDILKTVRGDWGIVVWNAPFFELTVSKDQSSLYSREFYATTEIIGNIHDNPNPQYL